MMVFLQVTHSLRAPIWPWIWVFSAIKSMSLVSIRGIAMLDSCDHGWRTQNLQSSCWSTRNNSFWASSTKHPLFFPLNIIYIQNCDAFQPSHLENSSSLQLGIQPAHLWAAGNRHINTSWVQAGEQTRRSEPSDGEIPWDHSTSLSVIAQPPQPLPAHSLCLKLFSDLWLLWAVYFRSFI